MCLVWYTYSAGALTVLYRYMVPVLAIVSIIVHTTAWRSGEIETEFLRRPGVVSHRKYWLVIANQWLLIVLSSYLMWKSWTYLQNSELENVIFFGILLASNGVLLICAAVPYRKTNVPANILWILVNVVFIVDFQRVHNPPALDQCVILGPPIPKQFYIMDGGNSPLFNTSYARSARRHAVKIFVANNRRGHDTVITGNNPFGHTFGEPVISPVAGVVCDVVRDRPDMPRGELDYESPAGNVIVIDVQSKWFVLLAHLQYDSIKVDVGDHVVQGQLLARCGKSGHTSEPILHLHVQDQPGIYLDGLTYLPIRFTGVILTGSGDVAPKLPVYPLRNNMFKPAEPFSFE